jgi:Fic family protein
LPALGSARLRQGRLLGELEATGFELQQEAELATSIVDVRATSALEGEVLPAESVRSSVAQRLGLARTGLRDRQVDGIVDVVLDATRHASKPLTRERLLAWHETLFPTGRSNFQRIAVGRYRDDAQGPMQVVSGVLGKHPVVHFEGPPARRVAAEMKALLAWVRGPARQLDGLVASGLAHLWFVTIHPFDDGNGRLARALADLVLARADGVTQRFWSMSAQLERERGDYYLELERTQRGGLDVTAWLAWFIGCFERSIVLSGSTLSKVRTRSAFWRAATSMPPFTERQQKMLKKILEQAELTVTVKQWAAACHCSIDTAQRDIADLVSRGVLARNEGGSLKTSYRFSWRSEQ